MKIVITGSKNDTNLTMSYVREFRRLNCEVKIFPDVDFYNKKLNKIKNRYLRAAIHRTFWKLLCFSINKKFIKAVDNYNPNLILILKGWHVSPKTLQIIKAKNPSTKLFCFNQENPFNTWNFSYSNSWAVKSITIFDAYLTWGKFLLELIKKFNTKKVKYLPFGYDPKVHCPVKINSKEKEYYGSDVAFIGAWDKEREEWLNHLLDYDLKIWGKGSQWRNASPKIRDKWQGQAVFGEEFSKVCNASKIVLDFLRKQMIPAHSMKTFEIPACKGFLMCNRGDEVNDFFEEGKEVVTFANAQEMIKKINYYLKHEEERKKIAQGGHEKLISSDFAYKNRALKILEVYNELNKNV